jgi:hypothetical protein
MESIGDVVLKGYREIMEIILGKNYYTEIKRLFAFTIRSLLPLSHTVDYA